MSKCKPSVDVNLGPLLDKGVEFEVADGYAVIRIPYELLRDDPDVQIAFQGLVRITTEEEEGGEQG